MTDQELVDSQERRILELKTEIESLQAENECLQNTRDAMEWIITDICYKAPEQVTVELLSSYITKLQGTLEKND